MVFQKFFRAIFVPPWLKQLALQLTQQVLARKNVQKTTFEAAQMILGPWNQQILSFTKFEIFKSQQHEMTS